MSPASNWTSMSKQRPSFAAALMILFAWNWYLAPTCQLAAATHEGAESVVQDNCKLMPRAYNFSCPQSGMAKHSDARRYAAWMTEKTLDVKTGHTSTSWKKRSLSSQKQNQQHKSKRHILVWKNCVPGQRQWYEPPKADLALLPSITDHIYWGHIQELASSKPHISRCLSASDFSCLFERNSWSMCNPYVHSPLGPRIHSVKQQ